MHHALTRSASDAHPRPIRLRGDEPSVPEPMGDVSRTRVEDGWVVARANSQPGEGRIIQLSYIYDPED